MNRFVFIAVNYNGSNFTIDYINSINNLSIEETDKIEIIIVDNDSDLIDLKKLEEYCNKIHNASIIKLNDNLGYFKGLNQGIQNVDKDNNTLLVIGNNDLTFDNDFIFSFKKIKYNRDVLVVAPNIVTKEGRQQNPHVIDSVPSIERLKSRVYFSNYYVGQAFRFVNQTIKRYFKKSIVLKNNYKQMKIKRGIGACYILTPNFFKKFNKLDDRVFMWGEESLLSNQVESIGGTILYDPTIIIQHYESASVNSIQSKKKYYMVKESYKIYRKYL